MSVNQPRTYSASCHCKAVRFTFKCEEIKSGRRCNCSICVRKGAVMSPSYVRPSEIDVEGEDNLSLYQFGDKAMTHLFCRSCGISPFSTVASIPPGYTGPARPGDYRVNLGCVDGLDVLSLNIEAIDGKSM